MIEAASSGMPQEARIASTWRRRSCAATRLPGQRPSTLMGRIRSSASEPVHSGPEVRKDSPIRFRSSLNAIRKAGDRCIARILSLHPRRSVIPTYHRPEELEGAVEQRSGPDRLRRRGGGGRRSGPRAPAQPRSDSVRVRGHAPRDWSTVGLLRQRGHAGLAAVAQGAGVTLPRRRQSHASAHGRRVTRGDRRSRAFPRRWPSCPPSELYLGTAAGFSAGCSSATHPRGDHFFLETAPPDLSYMAKGIAGTSTESSCRSVGGVRSHLHVARGCRE